MTTNLELASPLDAVAMFQSPNYIVFAIFDASNAQFPSASVNRYNTPSHPSTNHQGRHWLILGLTPEMSKRPVLNHNRLTIIEIRTLPYFDIANGASASSSHSNPLIVVRPDSISVESDAQFLEQWVLA